MISSVGEWQARVVGLLLQAGRNPLGCDERIVYLCCADTKPYTERKSYKKVPSAESLQRRYYGLLQSSPITNTSDGQPSHPIQDGLRGTERTLE